MKYYIFLFVLVLSSCKSEVKSEAIASDTSEVVEETTMRVIESEDGKLEVYDYDGIEPFLNKQDDKVHVINFWATWCKPCIKELPYFEALNENYNDDNVEVLLISLDFPQQYKKQLIPYIKKHNLQSKVIALDDANMNRWIEQVSANWSGAIPATIIYNKDKRQFYERSFTYEELETELKQFLK